jgi:hypothetical protein
MFFLPKIHRLDPSVPVLTVLTIRNGSCILRKYTAWILPTVLRNEYGRIPLEMKGNGFSLVKKQKEWILTNGVEKAWIRSMIPCASL